MSAAMARLEVVAGRAIGMSILLADELLIGRHADGAGRLADDEEISRSHARISLDRSGFCAIEDLGSTNGTFVNGLRISGPRTISVGDTIEVGGTTLVVRELPIPATELNALRRQSTMPPGSATAPGTSAGQVTPAARSAAHRISVGAIQRAGGGADAGASRAPAADEATTEHTPGPSSVSLRLEIDFAGRRATVALEDGSVPLRLAFDGDAWRPEPPAHRG